MSYSRDLIRYRTVECLLVVLSLVDLLHDKNEGYEAEKLEQSLDHFQVGGKLQDIRQMHWVQGKLALLAVLQVEHAED